METIRAHINSKQQAFARHPFFDVLKRLDRLEELNYFVPSLTFWVMVFQDILRLNEDRVTDPYLKKIAHHHKLEDAGHEQWFMHDRNYMGGRSSSSEDINWLFGKDTQPMRDPAYALLAEVYRSDSEWLNIVLLLAVESSGHVFFERVVEQVRKIGQDGHLKYFASSHLKVELSHSMFEEKMEQGLYAAPLPGKIRHDALALVDRCYDAFGKMFDGLLATCNRRLEMAQHGAL